MKPQLTVDERVEEFLGEIRKAFTVTYENRPIHESKPFDDNQCSIAFGIRDNDGLKKTLDHLYQSIEYHLGTDGVMLCLVEQKDDFDIGVVFKYFLDKSR